MTEPPQKPNPDHVRHDLKQLVSDYAMLTPLPKPAAHEMLRGSPSKDYGHPAQWASVNLTRIANLLWNWHGIVAQQRNETPPPPRYAHEKVRVKKAYRYLETRVQDLIDAVGPDALKEMARLHASIHSGLGMTGPRDKTVEELSRIDMVKSTIAQVLQK
jgi:hypothetical protein